nr:glypican-4 isoform X1 [Helicoverpa armigera]XP_049698389.1 glypican-4 isoform X2 [Helicoverpa armigera]XP_049698390.1 glypican-4 isoform X3 [Helicoverpa armigera]XP_049698391.1 glypican-4 isoform X4 [Helicoverpa armigera]XP_049698392.1 glypican-4 isoform X5 [Helicoverpa armigera]
MAVRECCCDKLSPNKKSIFGLRMRSQILYLLLASSFLAVASAADSEGTCANVKTIFEKNGMLMAVDLQAQPNSDADGLCTNRGCCGAGARSRLTQAARTQLESALWSELSKLSDTLTNRAIKFDEFFKRLLKQSREEFHMMFKRTYGMIYEQHSYVFEQLFEQLERYYTRGDTNFDEMMDGFFSILYNKMFTVLNSQYEFDEKYLKCVNEHMRDIQPFEDVPNKLSVQLRRAVVATRTFHKALRAGADVVRNMMQVEITNECVTAWARLRYCGSCAGHQPPACTRYCHNVIRGCLPAHADLGDQWDAYVDAVDKVADRLLGPFNIAMVVEPIDIKISEAIMSFQEHNREISQKIFTGCGKPVLGGGGGAGPFFAPGGKTRRSVRAIPDFDWPQKVDDVDDFEIEASFESLLNEDPSIASLRTPEGIRKATEDMAEQAKLRERFLQYMKGNIDLQEYEEHERKRRDAEPEPAAAGAMDIDFKSYDFDEKKGPKKKKPSMKSEESRGSDWGGPALEKLVRETRVRMRNTRRYWNHLPALLCTTTSITSAPCFNGSDVASYTLNAASEGTAGLASNPEVRGTASPLATASVATQADSLRTLTARLKDAYNGVEVQWLDTDQKDLQVASSYGREVLEDVESGSGSGDWGTSDGLPTDDEDLNGYDTAGSGDSAPEDEDQTEREPEVPPRPVVTEPPFVPSIVDTPGTNNVNVRTRILTEPDTAGLPNTDTGTVVIADNADNADATEPETPRSQDIPPVREQPVAGAADSPSLQKALFTYALPVVCAWFGTIVTDLF